MENSPMDFLVPLLFLGSALLFVAGMWKVFTKAGQPGWACLVPIYNMIVLLQIAGRPVWWFLLMFVPVVNFVVMIVISMDIAKNFGKGAGYGLGLALFGFVFFPVLGFSDAQYSPAS